MLGFICSTLLILFISVADCFKTLEENIPFQTVTIKISGEWLQKEERRPREWSLPFPRPHGQQEIPSIRGSRKCYSFLCYFLGLLQPSSSLHAFRFPLFNGAGANTRVYRAFCLQARSRHCIAKHFPVWDGATTAFHAHTSSVHSLSIQKDIQSYTSHLKLSVWTHAKQTLWKFFSNRDEFRSHHYKLILLLMHSWPYTNPS